MVILQLYIQVITENLALMLNLLYHRLRDKQLWMKVCTFTDRVQETFTLIILR